MKATAKIRRRKNKKGYAFTFSIVNNFRDPVSQVPTNRTLSYLGSIRETDIPRKAAQFHARLDAALDKLQGQIFDNCAEEIRRRFEVVVPRPKVTTASPLKDIRATLAARGYHV